MLAIVEVVSIRIVSVEILGIASSTAQQEVKVSLAVLNTGSIGEQEVLRMVLVLHFEHITLSMVDDVSVSVPTDHSTPKRWLVVLETIYPSVDHSF